MEKRAEELRGHNQEALRSLAQERERLDEERTAFQEFQQVDGKVGSPLSGNTSHQARRSLPGDRRWHSGEQFLEY